MSSVTSPSATPADPPGPGSGGDAAAQAPQRAPMDLRVAALTRFAISITAFTVIGHLWLGIETAWAAPVVALLASYTVELLLEALSAWSNGRRPEFLGGVRQCVVFLLPAHISGLAIAMLIYPGDQLWPFVFAAVVAGSAKHLFRAPLRGRFRHFMNPSNLGIAATLTLFPWVGIAIPYQFTSDVSGVFNWIIPLAILASGLLLNIQLTGKWPIVLAWMGGFAAQAVIRALVTDTDPLAALAPMTGVVFLLFTNYMITDPGTTPVRPRDQVVFALTAAGIYGLLTGAHVVYGIFYCLIATCLLRGALMWATAWWERNRAADGAHAPPVGPETRPER
ncbi:hypothetical protein GCM10009799_09060 [Nocardiopsis rhodophaea]|uniref:UnbU n=1 Tax=Nocardiopsis rhodophaea TaxID=280238 RepID=A0ABP5DWU6_9ACTN